MHKPVREVTLNVGKGVYTVSTQLPDEVIDGIREVMAEACGEAHKGARQEEVLLMACLRLAYSIVDVSGKLRAVLGE